ncbi:DNA repair protein XRCC2-like, partial [Acanthaster planci]|uniref:DNA repair protein XRCC2-like n=1 Tax=Acanthaster planci TaxID=133434 RepID=A0A8B7YZU5_ACAPL
ILVSSLGALWLNCAICLFVNFCDLFARLGSKPSLESLDLRLFPPPHFLRPGDAVEFYGPSGCGKTEILLHLTSNCILPETWRGAELGGRGVGMILVDTDFQFSMLRLFQVLESRIIDAMEQRKAGIERPKEPRAACCASDASTPSGNADLKTEPSRPELGTCKMCETQRTTSDGTSVSDRTELLNVNRKSCLCDDVQMGKQTGRKRTRTGQIISCNGECSKRIKEQVGSGDPADGGDCFEMPTADQIEAFIKTCLNRFYLVRAGGGSDQLVVTLHSLESLIANRPDVGVLMLENVGAFYWTDRMSGSVASVQEANQRRAVAVIKRLIGEYQLVLLTTKPALIQRGQRSYFRTDEDCVTPTTRSNPSHSDYEHHEFMCSAWNKLITHRFVMKRHEHVVHAHRQISTQSHFTALRTLPTPGYLCRFAITNKGVVHQ